jgi:hypothetical protein
LVSILKYLLHMQMARKRPSVYKQALGSKETLNKSSMVVSRGYASPVSATG